MDTKVKKNKLIKPTQSLVHISIERYGGEFYMGTVDRASYEFFKKNRIDINEYGNSANDDIWSFIPSEHQILPSGMPFECDDLGHVVGATMDEDNYITVYDHDWDAIWTSNLDFKKLKKQGVKLNFINGTQLDDLTEGTVVFYGSQGEKGTFFECEIKLQTPFDPKKLKLYYTNLNGKLVSQSRIEYDGEEFNGSSGYSTSGTGTLYQFLIIGDEEVYDIRNDFDEE